MSMSVCERPVASPRHRSRCAVRSYFVRFEGRTLMPQGLPQAAQLACGYCVVRLDASLDEAREQPLARVRRTVVAVGHPFGQGCGLPVR